MALSHRRFPSPHVKIESMNWILIVAAIGCVLQISSAWQADNETCGRQPESMNIRIIGGDPADDHEWPWMAALFQNDVFICGASLVAEDWVITAAHCIDPFVPAADFKVMVGTNSLLSIYADRSLSPTASTSSSTSEQVRTAIAKFFHPDFVAAIFDYDIALLRMESPFLLSSDFTVNTVCLPTTLMTTEPNFQSGSLVTITGWGRLESCNYAQTTQLYDVSVPILDHQNCTEAYRQLNPVTDNMFCGGKVGPQGRTGPFGGDSGGPVVAFRQGNKYQFYLLGIVSWATVCSCPQYPGVFTRVTQFEDWIKPIFNGGYPETRQFEESSHNIYKIMTITLSVVLAVLPVCFILGVGLRSRRVARTMQHLKDKIRILESQNSEAMTTLMTDT